jgi:hypothetical protein
MLRPTLLLLVVLSVCHAYSTPLLRLVLAKPVSRRSLLVVPLIAAPTAAMALDMDAFINKELESTTTSCDEKINKKCRPKLSDDEALCRFGSPSKATGEACVRAGMPTTKAGGVDAFGKLDRGDFIRCKTLYEDDGGPKFTRKRKCEDGSGKVTITVFKD